MSYLRFSSNDEEEYNQHLFEEDLTFIRKMLILTSFLYASFGITDWILEVPSINLFFIIRYGIIIPSIAIVFIISFTSIFYKIHQYLLTYLYVLGGFGIVVMLALEPEIFSYYGGLFLVFGSGYFLLRIKWEFVTIGSVTIMMFYFILAFIHLDEYLFNAMIYSIFYIAFVIIALSGSYTFSKYRRQRYHEETILISDNTVLEKQNVDISAEIENANYITIYSLAKLAESRDSYTGDHIDRVGRLSLQLAHTISTSVYNYNSCDKAEFIRTIELASTLHDIGKISVPENILMKAGPYTFEEREGMKKHCLLGSTTLRSIQNKNAKNSFINMGIDICECHHENWDGTGYPRKLKGREIPFSARIVAVIDVYDALISERPYKKAWPIKEAISEIKKLSGIKFDKDVVNAFIKCIDENLCTI